ncbi:copper chaperone PCu(A)C [Paracoccus benzoatiresistens]|uniref:Copper chaperone PCu(A)C n=1 Tax=Paracoccus benzoatiresistens TaxID=2997341 RepID=A0ABT4IZR2_9RHOB|nr:copper chaperone PCu(A)C [Paracoccus sp. EF6]MCZ0960355.1 copper chaperone PCu(A)C [Paracoccus sp. EF6]
MIRMILAALAVVTPAMAMAQDGLEIRDAYVRSANPKTAAAFMVVENHGGTDCRLTGVSSDAAERVELHTHAEQDGMMKMQKIEGGIAIPAGGEHALARGGDHVMLMGLTKPLADGDGMMLTLDFGDCGTQQVQAALDNDRTEEAAEGHGGDGDHQGH